MYFSIFSFSPTVNVGSFYMICMEFQRHRISQDITKQQQGLQSQVYIAGSTRLASNNQIENIIENND